MKLTTILAGAALAIALPMAASAGVIYDNPTDNAAGDCSFNTTCAADVGRGNDFAAQLFTLADAATVKSASFTTFDSGSGGPTANWAFYQADGAGGLPGTLVSSGSSSILANVTIGTLFGFYNTNQNFFDLPSVSLGAGSYYFAVQYVTPTFQNYLSRGVAGSGAAETFNGGGSWQQNYENMPSVAVALYDTSYGSAGGGVPEPASWALMIGGFGLAGATLRRRRAMALTA